MKKLLLLLLFLSAISQAQIVNIPDANFKNKLVNLPCIDTDLDGFADADIDTNDNGEIEMSEALAVTSVLNLSNCNITDLTGIETFSNMPAFNCSHNQLTTLNVSGMTNLNWINCSYNQLTSLDFTGLPRLGGGDYSHNLFTSLDFSNYADGYLPTNVQAGYNPNLIYVVIKNGSMPTGFGAQECNNLQYVCTDEMFVNFIKSQIGFENIFPEVNSYCSFVLGGNFNTITGSITFDHDNDGCDSTDPNQPYVKLNLTSGNNSYALFTSLVGVYNNFGLTGTFNIGLAIENAGLFTVTPPVTTIVFDNANNNIATQDFCITANGIHNDLETVIVPLQPARPGFDATYKIVYKNKGNQVLSGSVDFTYQENELDFVNASIIPDAQSSGALSWNFTNLYPFESRSIEVRLNVNSPMETPAVNIGDQLNFSVQANPLSGDVTPADNVFSIKQIVVGSFDPNDITCLEGEHVNPTEIGNYLHYNINFENTGTAAAENIVVKDMIDLTKYDISSLQILNASHPMTPRITNGKVEFIFEGINLGASEHGNVTFKIRTKNTLVTGNSVSQKADIYFDYNFPVATNVAMTTFDTLGTNIISDNDISIYPNPTNGIVNIKAPSGVLLVELFDLRGRKLRTVTGTAVIDVSPFGHGVYFVKVFTANGSGIQRLLKK